MTVATLVNQILFGPLSNGVTRFYAPAMEQNDLTGYLKAVRRLVLFAIVLVLPVVMVVVIGVLLARRAEWIAIVIAALAYATVSGCNSILNGIQNAARQRAVVALNQGMEPWMRFIAAAGLLLSFGATSTAAMIGYAVGAMFVLCSQYVFYRKIVPKNAASTITERSWSSQICIFSWPFASWGVFYWAQSSSDRWALEFFRNSKDVGLYAVLYQLGYYPISMATTMAVQLLAPIFYQRAGDASDGARNANVSYLSWRLTYLALGVTGAAFIVALLLHTQIFKILVAKEYASASYLLPWMLFAGGIFATGQIISLNLMSQMKPHLMITAKIVTALLGVIFNFAGAYWFGIEGVVLANILFSVLFSLWMVTLQIKMKKSYIWPI
jgi:O-antigen/teichoic acid export membrane protein